ncbi:MAG: pentapeptide repeat-containing protein [Synechococcales cyanobacterium C42_A2020_086]|nr:pentapeptide repeat-containing protein [Synechococcales cyanobacterium C42_A2020_086]
MFNTWRVLLAGLIVGSLMTAGVFAGFPVMSHWRWKWPDWTGIGEETITKTSTERLGRETGQIQRVTITEEPVPGKKLWDFLELSGTLAIPILLVYLGSQIQKKDREIAYLNLREEALQGYFDRISDILLDRNISNLGPNDSSLDTIKDVVRARTLAVLRRLDNDGERKGSVIQFLVDTDFLGMYLALDLSFANLRGAKLRGINLSRARLNNADLSNADLSGADLSNANLSDTNLDQANLSNAYLTSSELYNSSLVESKLVNAELISAKLKGAQLIGADLSNADLSNADLSNADLSNADLSNANLSGADLRAAKLALAKLHGANFEAADVEGVAGLKPEQASTARNLRWQSG